MERWRVTIAREVGNFHVRGKIMKKTPVLVVLAVVGTAYSALESATVTVDLSQVKAIVPSTLYGSEQQEGH